MAVLSPVSASMRFTLNLGTVEGKAVTKTVSVNNVATGAAPAALLTVANALTPLLQYSTTAIKKYETSLLTAD